MGNHGRAFCALTPAKRHHLLEIAREASSGGEAIENIRMLTERRWEKPMLDLVSHRKYRPITWAAPAPNQGVPGEWVSREREFVETTCSKCHTDQVHLKFADTYTKGRRLTAEVGCHACHPIDAFRDFPRIGPTLTDLKKKTTPDFLVRWVSYPKAFRPRTNSSAL